MPPLVAACLSLLVADGGRNLMLTKGIFASLMQVEFFVAVKDNNAIAKGDVFGSVCQLQLGFAAMFSFSLNSTAGSVLGWSLGKHQLWQCHCVGMCVCAATCYQLIPAAGWTVQRVCWV